MQAQASGTRRRTYEEIVAGEQDIALRSVQFTPTEKLTAEVEEFEAKASRFEGETREQLEHIAKLGREELAKRDGGGS
jgi:hypothetical protein